MKLVLAVFAVLVVARTRSDEPKIWAVLIAGSNQYYNYRHQADVCHAYQILHQHGVPDERLIVMMYDDIANNEENPLKGNVINHPQGKDVYHGVPKDYIKDTVTPINFLKVLSGEVPEGGSGKTLNSTANDHVFINFADHGAPGILGFPGRAPVLTVKDFIATLKKMHDDKKYAKMVIYIEACESGSMFDGVLPNDIEIFATTAANSHESSYACYYDKERSTYLGDTYSVSWMEDTDKHNIEVETIQHQFEITKSETKQSHVQQFGDREMAMMNVGEFQGHKQAVGPMSYETVERDSVQSVDVPIMILQQRIMAETNPEVKVQLTMQLKAIFENRYKLKTQMFKMADSVASDVAQSMRVTGKQRPLVDIDCHDAIVKHFDRECLGFGQNTFAMRFVYMLVNMCEEKIPTATIIKEIDVACQPLKGINGYYL
jgi:legumain